MLITINVRELLLDVAYGVLLIGPGLVVACLIWLLVAIRRQQPTE